MRFIPGFVAAFFGVIALACEASAREPHYHQTNTGSWSAYSYGHTPNTTVVGYYPRFNVQLRGTVFCNEWVVINMGTSGRASWMRKTENSDTNLNITIYRNNQEIGYFDTPEIGAYNTDVRPTCNNGVIANNPRNGRFILISSDGVATAYINQSLWGGYVAQVGDIYDFLGHEWFVRSRNLRANNCGIIRASIKPTGARLPDLWFGENDPRNLEGHFGLGSTPSTSVSFLPNRCYKIGGAYRLYRPVNP